MPAPVSASAAGTAATGAAAAATAAALGLGGVLGHREQLVHRRQRNLDVGEEAARDVGAADEEVEALPVAERLQLGTADEAGVGVHQLDVQEAGERRQQHPPRA